MFGIANSRGAAVADHHVVTRITKYTARVWIGKCSPNSVCGRCRPSGHPEVMEALGGGAQCHHGRGIGEGQTGFHDLSFLSNTSYYNVRNLLFLCPTVMEDLLTLGVKSLMQKISDATGQSLSFFMLS